MDEVLVKINGDTHYFWRAVVHEDNGLKSYVENRRGSKVTLKYLRKATKRYGSPKATGTDKLR